MLKCFGQKIPIDKEREMNYLLFRCNKCSMGEIILESDPSLDGKKCRIDGCGGAMKFVEKKQSPSLETNGVNSSKRLKENK